MTLEAIITVTRHRQEPPEFEPSYKLSWPTDRIFATAMAGVGTVIAAGTAVKAVATVRVVEGTTIVAVKAVGEAAQAAEKPQAHADNFATSATATSIYGVSAHYCCASAARRKDKTSSIARTWTTR